MSRPGRFSEEDNVVRGERESESVGGRVEVQYPSTAKMRILEGEIDVGSQEEIEEGIEHPMGH